MNCWPNGPIQPSSVLFRDLQPPRRDGRVRVFKVKNAPCCALLLVSNI